MTLLSRVSLRSCICLLAWQACLTHGDPGLAIEVALPQVPNPAEIASSRRHATSIYRPVDPLSAFSKQGSDGMLSIDKMVGPMGENSAIFSKLYITNDYRGLPMSPLEIVRGQWSTGEGIVTWQGNVFTWVSPDFSHQPLYFEQPNLERYGTGPGRLWQPPLAMAHFFGALVLTPYKLFVQHPCEQVYSLGSIRPGNCAPKEHRTLVGQSYPWAVLKYWRDDCR